MTPDDSNPAPVSSCADSLNMNAVPVQYMIPAIVSQLPDGRVLVQPCFYYQGFSSPHSQSGTPLNSSGPSRFSPSSYQGSVGVMTPGSGGQRTTFRRAPLSEPLLPTPPVPPSPHPLLTPVSARRRAGTDVGYKMK